MGHNPQADFAERMRVRESFNLQDHLRGGSAPAARNSEVTLTVEQLRAIARAGGFDLIPVTDPAAPKQAEDRSSRIAELELANASLLQRLNAAEAEIRSYHSPKDPGTQPQAEKEAEVFHSATA